MSADGWIVVPGWDKFQHYHDRNPVWIKLYLELRSDDGWRQLSLAGRGLLVSIWIEFGASRGVLRASDLPSRVAQKNLRRTLDSLRKAGFIQVSASKPLALTRSREKEKEKKDLRKSNNQARQSELELLTYPQYLETLH
jgi:hypothetical protein